MSLIVPVRLEPFPSDFPSGEVHPHPSDRSVPRQGHCTDSHTEMASGRWGGGQLAMWVASW